MDLPQLAASLRSLRPRSYHVVTLPDFFLDHLVALPPWAAAVPAWQGVHARSGGNVPTPNQRLQAGGNAANTALALARLGVRTHLVTRTSAFGRVYLDQTLGQAGVDLAHARADGQLSVTTALEFAEERPVNVMLSDPGSLAQFGPESLTANDWTLLEGCDLVLLANWSQNRRGTALVEAVAERASRLMLDTGDFSHRLGDLAELRSRVLGAKGVSIVGLNENELRLLTGRALAEGEEEVAAARDLRGTGDRVVDLHTARFSATFAESGEAVVPSFDVEPLRVTGAGDAWNAGNVLGHLAGLPPVDRLLLANAVAGLYVCGKEGLAPTLPEVVRFLESGPKMRAL